MTTTLQETTVETWNAEQKPSNHVTVAAPPESSLVNIIAHAASDPNMSVEKLEKLIQLQQGVMAHQARQEFATDFAKMKTADWRRARGGGWGTTHRTARLRCFQSKM